MSIYVKSPLNYIGGKFKLLPQIIPLFPDRINNFIDLFCGGANIGINANADTIICNDIQKEVIGFCNVCKKQSSSELLRVLKDTIELYKLSKVNKEGYINLRNDYNSGNRAWNTFYALVSHSFNNQISFNKKHEFTESSGRNRSWFNPNLEANFIKFIDHLKTKNIDFISYDFRNIKFTHLSEEDFLYVDPPYLIASANYNRNGSWSNKDEIDLLNILDDFNSKKVRFALSNVLRHKGKSNNLLKDWSSKYNVHRIENDYRNCIYCTKDKSIGSTDEVLITNYLKGA